MTPVKYRWMPLRNRRGQKDEWRWVSFLDARVIAVVAFDAVVACSGCWGLRKAATVMGSSVTSVDAAECENSTAWLKKSVYNLTGVSRPSMSRLADISSSLIGDTRQRCVNAVEAGRAARCC